MGGRKGGRGKGARDKKIKEEMGAAGEAGVGSLVASIKNGKGSVTASSPASAPASAPVPAADGQPVPGSYSDWAAAFQAYYAAGAQPPPGAFGPHPYLWGGQPMMPPYGAPPPYGGMFPAVGGMYGHPGMYGQYGTPALEMATEHADSKRESLEGGAKSQIPRQTSLKRSKGSKGSLVMLNTKGSAGGGKQNGAGVTAPSSNGDENESRSDGSTDDASEDKSPRNLTRKRSFDQMAPDAAGEGGYVPPHGQSLQDTPVLGTPAPGGGLEMSLDYWSTGSAPPVKGNKQTSASPSTSAPPAELWLQDERELKRQRRKQSNRESARRSRLRKQAECEGLGTRVDTLTVENMALRTELSRMTEECKRLQAENASLHEQLRITPEEVTVASSEPEPEHEDGPVINKEEEDSQPKGNGKLKRKEEKKPAGETTVSRLFSLLFPMPKVILLQALAILVLYAGAL